MQEFVTWCLCHDEFAHDHAKNQEGRPEERTAPPKCAETHAENLTCGDLEGHLG